MSFALSTLKVVGACGALAASVCGVYMLSPSPSKVKTIKSLLEESKILSFDAVNASDLSSSPWKKKIDEYVKTDTGSKEKFENFSLAGSNDEQKIKSLQDKCKSFLEETIQEGKDNEKNKKLATIWCTSD